MAIILDGNNYWNTLTTWNLPADKLFTIAISAYCTGDSADALLLGCRNSINAGWGLLRVAASDTLNFYTYDGGVHGHQFDTNFMPASTWCNIVVRGDGTKVYCYINGSVSTLAPTLTAAVANALDLLVGSGYTGAGQQFIGTLGKLALFSRDIGATDATALSNGTPAWTLSPAPAYYWSLDTVRPMHFTNVTSQYYSTATDYDLPATWTMLFDANFRSDSTLAIAGRRNATAGWKLERQATNDTVRLTTYNGSTNTHDSPNSSCPINTDLRVCVRCDGSFIYFYINGSASGSGVAYTAPSALASVALYLGAENNNGTVTNAMKGEIDTVAFFNADVGAANAALLSGGTSPVDINPAQVDHYFRLGDLAAIVGGITLTPGAGIPVEAAFGGTRLAQAVSKSEFVGLGFDGEPMVPYANPPVQYNYWSTDPLWASPTTGNFRPRRASPLIGAGAVVANIGQTVKGAAPDAGSVEWAGIVPPMPGRKSRVSMSMRL